MTGDRGLGPRLGSVARSAGRRIPRELPGARGAPASYLSLDGGRGRRGRTLLAVISVEQYATTWKLRCYGDIKAQRKGAGAPRQLIEEHRTAVLTRFGRSGRDGRC